MPGCRDHGGLPCGGRVLLGGGGDGSDGDRGGGGADGALPLQRQEGW